MDTTITVNNQMSVDEIQVQVDSIDRYIASGSVVVIQFSDGVYIVDKTIRINGFYGGGILTIQGNTAEVSSDICHTTQQVFLDASASPISVFQFNGCMVPVTILRNLKMKINCSAPSAGVDWYLSFYMLFGYNYVFGTAAQYGHDVQAYKSSMMLCRSNVLGKVAYGISSIGCPLLHSENNVDNGINDRPAWGLHVKYGGVISKQGTQPVGSSGPQKIEYGGEIR